MSKAQTHEEMMAHFHNPVRIRLAEIKVLSHDLGPDKWRERFALIREAYALLMPRIKDKARYAKTISPYFIDWDWSPIEFNAWCIIREKALPFYPQFPVSGFFLDFADPYRKICIELDGKAFHDPEKDARRDAVLRAEGWEIFRISGAMANTYMADVLPEYLVDVDQDGAESDDQEYERRDLDEQMRSTTIDGFFDWLKKWFYSKEEIAEAANPTPDDDEEGDDDGDE